MQISESTREVLKNFAEINQNLLVNPGKKLSTISTMKNILAKAEIEEEFPQEMGIYDLHEFLGTLGLFQKPVLKFDEKNMVINEDGVVSMLARPAFNPRYDGFKFANLGFLDHRHPELRADDAFVDQLMFGIPLPLGDQLGEPGRGAGSTR